MDLYKWQSSEDKPESDTPDAWLYKNWAPGRLMMYASVDANDTAHWPIDQWTRMEKLPLYLATPNVAALREALAAIVAAYVDRFGIGIGRYSGPIDEEIQAGAQALLNNPEVLP